MSEPARTRPRRLIAAVPGGILALASALMLLLLAASPPPDASLVVFIAVVTALPLALGLWLLHYGWPSLLPAAKLRLARLGDASFWAGTVRYVAGAFAPADMKASSFRRTAVALAVGVLGFYVTPRGARSAGIFFAYVAYSLADPIINAFRPRWWLNAAKSLLGYVALFVASVIIAEVDDIGEAGMIFMLPMMIFPVTLGVSALIRFLWFYLPPA
jgi:hypothetical protein